MLAGPNLNGEEVMFSRAITRSFTGRATTSIVQTSPHPSGDNSTNANSGGKDCPTISLKKDDMCPCPVIRATSDCSANLQKKRAGRVWTTSGAELGPNRLESFRRRSGRTSSLHLFEDDTNEATSSYVGSMWKKRLSGLPTNTGF